MGFENRKAVRVKLDSRVYFWLGGRSEGPGLWGHTQNLSVSGVAFHCDQSAPKGELVTMELHLPKSREALRLSGKVVHCSLGEDGQRDYQWRVNFGVLDDEVRHAVRIYVLELAEPGTGWGRAYFPGQGPVDLKYKEMSAADREQWLQKRAYLSMKELGYLKVYQAMLQHALGSGLLEGLKIRGSRPLKDGSDVWMELDLPLGQLHFLARTLWCRQEPDAKAESGLQLIAFHKDEAMKLEKEF